MKTIKGIKQLVGVLLTTLMASNVYAACSVHLDMGSNDIINVGNIDTISINDLAFPTVDGNATQLLATNGSGTIDWVEAGVVDSGWIEVGSGDFMNGFGNHTEDGFQSRMSYRKIDDVVEVRGFVTGAVPNSWPMLDNDGYTSIFRLPGGFRPTAPRNIFNGINSDGSARFDITSTGYVDVLYYPSGSPAWASLDATFFVN